MNLIWPLDMTNTLCLFLQPREIFVQGLIVQAYFLYSHNVLMAEQIDTQILHCAIVTPKLCFKKYHQKFPTKFILYTISDFKNGTGLSNQLNTSTNYTLCYKQPISAELINKL
jgi:hypothetical protein